MARGIELLKRIGSMLVAASLVSLIVKIGVVSSSALATTAFPSPEIKNLGPAFQAYWKEIKDAKVPTSDIEQHVRLFKKHVVRDEARFYLDVVFDKRDQGKTLDDLLREALTESAPLFEKHAAQIEANIKTFESSVHEQLARLRKAIPDFKVETPIYGMVSLNKFAGGVRLNAGQQVLAMSFDKLATLDREFPMVFAHESFHIYHHQVNPRLREELSKSSDLLVAGMFIEGIATFAEGELNPDKRHRRMVTDLESWCRSKAYKRYISEFLEDNGKLSAATFDANKALYRKWFYTSRDRDYPFPTEAAYCIGDQVVTSLSQKHSLQDMARWDVAKMIAVSKPVLEAWR
jgi:hypothetical protein